MRDGFQPCALETGGAATVPRWERSLVVFALGVHVIALSLDLLVLRLFYEHSRWVCLLVSTGVILWAWAVASLYVIFGDGNPPLGDIDDAPRNNSVSAASRVLSILVSIGPIRIFTEAHSCIFHDGDTDYFHTLRLIYAVLQSAPNAVLQLYALVIWDGVPGTVSVAADDDDFDKGSAKQLLRLSVFACFVSVGLGLAMWEQKVQFRSSSFYVTAVAVMRFFLR